MQPSEVVGLTAISILILAAAGLTMSLQLTNPLVAGDSVSLEAVVTVALLVAGVLSAVAYGSSKGPRDTPYW